MKFAQFFITRPIFAIVLSLIILVCGIISAFNLPISEYPEVAPPTVIVRATYPGANPKTIGETVAAPLEQAIVGVENMLYMSSQATSDGILTLTITFALGTDLDKAQVQVQNRVTRTSPTLPQEVQQQGVTVDKASPDLTLLVHLYSPDNRYDLLYLSNYATLHVRDELAKLDGVGDVRTFGMGNYSLRVWLDPNQVASRNLTASDVVAAIQEQNRQVAAGVIGGQPAANDASFQLSINTQGRLVSEEEFGNIIVRTGPHGEITRLKDVARIELGSNQYALHSLLNKQTAVAIPIYQRPGANSIDVSDAVRVRMAELKKTFPEGLDYTIIYDPTIFVRSSFHAVVHTLFEAIALVVVVVILFLQTWRASIIPLAAVPVSLVGTFAVMHLLGFSFNSLSLFGLVLAIGIVVDDAIVVVENVERNIALGKSVLQATKQAMAEVTGPIIATALVLCAVFVPTAFISGLTGQFYKQFALTIAISTVISAFNSLTLSPALAAILLREHGAQKDRLSVILDRLLAFWLFKPFNKALAFTNTRYLGAVRKGIRFTSTVLILYVGIIVLTWLGLSSTPTGFVPPQDKEYLLAAVELPAAASLDRTEAVVNHVANIIGEQRGVANTGSFPGMSINGFTNSSNSGAIFIPLTSFDERKTADLSATAIAAKLSARLSGMKEARVAIFAPPPVRGMGALGGFRLQVEDRGNLGYDELYRQVQNVLTKARQLPELDPKTVFSSFQVNVPQIAADVDREKAKTMGVSISDIFTTMQIYLGSYYANDFNRFGRTYQVNVQADRQFRADPDQIGLLKVRNNQGDMIPLSTFLNVSNTTGPDRVMHYNGFLTAEINGAAAPGYSSGQAEQAITTLLQQELPSGMTFEWTDLTYQRILAGNTAIWIFPLCVLLAFLVLAAQYESWGLPLAVVLIVPTVLFSAITGVILTHGDNNIFTQIGLIVLVGLACKNAILIVEFAREKETEGLDSFRAVVEACRLRLRPILMTSFAFIMGVVPLVVSSGAGSEMRRALGITVFSGMIGVTCFGLLLTPVFYMVVNKFMHKPVTQKELK